MTVAAEPAAARVEPVTRVDKPWGHELVFAAAEGLYVGKLLHIDAGGQLSLQRHDAKDETVAVLAGRVLLEIGPDEHRLEALELGPGQAVRIRPGVVHRMTGMEPAVVAEASTAGPGWRHDVVRLVDSYGREGTAAP